MAYELIPSNKGFIGVLRNTNFATQGGLSANFEKMSYKEDWVFQPNIKVQSHDDISGATSLLKEKGRAFTEATGIHKLSFSGPAVRANLAEHLVAALQSVTEVGTTPFQKVITPKANTDMFYDLANDDGYTWAVAICPTGLLASTDNDVIQKAMLDQLELSFDFLADGKLRLAQLSGTWAGMTKATKGALTGTWVAQSLENFYNNTDSYSLKIDEQNGMSAEQTVIKKAFSLSINNNIKPFDLGASGIPGAFLVSPQIKIKYSTPYLFATDQSYLMKAAAENGYECITTLVSSIGSGTAGHLNIAAYGRITAPPMKEMDRMKYIECDIDVEYNGSDSLEITIADANDRNYPAPA